MYADPLNPCFDPKSSKPKRPVILDMDYPSEELTRNDTRSLSRFLFRSLSSGMKKWFVIAATVAIIALIARQGTGFSKEAALEALKELSNRPWIWAIPTYVAVHTVTLTLCFPHAVFFEAGASILFGFLPALLCVFSAKVLAASFSFWIGSNIEDNQFRWRRRYNNGATSANKAPEENVGSCSPHDSSVAKIMGSGSSSDNPLNQQSSLSERASQREAALMKFRLKRKERCFEKKVRYHSRGGNYLSNGLASKVNSFAREMILNQEMTFEQQK